MFNSYSIIPPSSATGCPLTNLMKDPTTIPDSSITSNTPSTDGSQPSDIKDKGFKVPSNLPDNSKPTVTTQLSEPTVVEKVNLKDSKNVKDVKVVGVDENGDETVIFEGILPNDGVVRNDKPENMLKQFKEIRVEFIAPVDPSKDYEIKEEIHACIHPVSPTTTSGKFELKIHTFVFVATYGVLFQKLSSNYWCFFL